MKLLAERPAAVKATTGGWVAFGTVAVGDLFFHGLWYVKRGEHHAVAVGAINQIEFRISEQVYVSALGERA